jgi:elongation factor P
MRGGGAGVHRENQYGARRFRARAPPWGRARDAIRIFTVKVIASSIRKGNIIEREDGQLYVVLSAESFHPGKGTPTTQIDMRRISDGVKTTDRYKTTEQVERAFVEDRDHTYLYEDSDGYTFMNADNYEQLTVPKDVIGDQAQWLQEGMKVVLSVFNGVAVAVQLPQRVTFEITETEPAMKGQTASSSYKPATLSNGARIMVPPHIAAGTRVVVLTEDGSYSERAKD